MSVKIYFATCSPLWDEAQLHESLAKMPAPIRDKIAAYKNPADQQSRVQGKLLLLALIRDFGLDLTLDDLQYSSFNKPHFLWDFDFSISHCDGMVMCAGARCAKIGIDIEPMREIDVQDYREELTPSEWHLIKRSPKPSNAFLQTWTKKEALLKATGRGIDMDMGYIDVSNNLITVHKEPFSIFPIPTYGEYIAHIAIYIDYAKMRDQDVRFSMVTTEMMDVR